MGCSLRAGRQAGQAAPGGHPQGAGGHRRGRGGGDQADRDHSGTGLLRLLGVYMHRAMDIVYAIVMYISINLYRYTLTYGFGRDI